MRYLRLVLLAIPLLAGVLHAPVHGQDATPPLYVGEQILWNQTLWTPDGSTLFFASVDNGLHHFQLQPGDGTLTELDRPPFTIELTPQQQTQFLAAGPLAFVSFDGAFIIYESQYQIHGSESGTQNRLALGNLRTREHTVIKKGAASVYSIFWNASSSAALIIDVGTSSLGGIHYVSGFRESIAETHTTLLMSYMAGSHAYVDMAGRYVLLPEQWEGRQTGLRLWDATMPAPPQQFAAADSPVLLADQTVHGAAFVPGRDDQLLIVTQDGIVRYDLATDEAELVNAAIHTGWVDWAYFSPDARYVAVLSQPQGAYRGFSCQLYVLPVDFQGDVAVNDYACRFYG